MTLPPTNDDEKCFCSCGDALVKKGNLVHGTGHRQRWKGFARTKRRQDGDYCGQRASDHLVYGELIPGPRDRMRDYKSSKGPKIIATARKEKGIRDRN